MDYLPIIFVAYVFSIIGLLYYYKSKGRITANTRWGIPAPLVYKEVFKDLKHLYYKYIRSK